MQKRLKILSLKEKPVSIQVVEKPPQEPKTPFSFLVDSKLAVEKTTTRIKIRQSHLALRDVSDPYTNRALELMEATEETIDGWITEELVKHPAYHWFSRIKGIGNENIGKVLGPINIQRAHHISSFWKYAGMHVVNVEVSPEQQQTEIETSIEGLQAKLDQLRRKATKKKIATSGTEETEAVEIALTPDVIGDIMTSISTRLDGEFVPVTRGYAPRRSIYKESKTKLDYNSELRTMCFRLAGSLIKAQGAYARYYDNEKNKLVARYQNQSIHIIPTLELPTRDGKIFEPVGTIASGHVHMQAMRKMIKLFLSHLWLVWRKALGLEITLPYAHAQLGHIHIITPEEMMEKPAPRHRRQSVA